MKGYSIEYKLVTSIYGIEYKVVTSIILHLEYKWSTIVVLQSRHTRGGGINIIYRIASIMVYQMPERSSKRKAKRESPTSSICEPDSSSLRSENVPVFPTKILQIYRRNLRSQ